MWRCVAKKNVHFISKILNVTVQICELDKNLWESTVYIFGCSCVGEKGTLHNFFATKNKCECFSCFYFYFISKRHKLHWGNQCHLREMINDWSRRGHVRLGNVHRWRCMRADSRKDFISEGLWLFDWQKDPTDSISTAWRCFHIPFLFIVEEERLYFIRLLNIELWHYVGKDLTFYLENLGVIYQYCVLIELWGKHYISLGVPLF